MRLFLDSSAFAKRFVNETGSVVVERLCARASDLGLSVICALEVVSAMNRRSREGLLTAQRYAQAKRRLAEDVHDADIIQINPDITRETVALLERHPLRAMDAIHVASALFWNADLFVSADIRQLAAAEAAGLTTESV